MEDWQQRVIDEHTELVAKMDKLLSFLSTQQYAGLSVKDRELLVRQWNAMMGYAMILAERCRSFRAPS